MKNRNRFFALLIVLMCFASNAFSAPAIVSYVRGKGEVCRGEKWLQLKIGDKINPSETISTGFQSEVKIKYNDSLMVLGALTRITLDEFSETENKDTVSAYLSTGAVRSKVIHTESKRVSYTVKSPVAVASVRGTDFIVTSAGAIRKVPLLSMQIQKKGGWLLILPLLLNLKIPKRQKTCLQVLMILPLPQLLHQK